MNQVRFAFLVLEEHPYGRVMLQELLAHGFAPALIIQEVSRVGDEERQKFLDRMAGQPLPPRISQLTAGTKIPLYNVSNHNDNVCQAQLVKAGPDVTVLGGTRILKQQVLEIPSRGTINAHPGLLPRLRGSASVGWALYQDLPVGSTVHFIDSGIDTGDIIYREALPVYRGDTYESLNYRVAQLSARLMARALQAFAVGEVPRQRQNQEDGETLRVIPDDLLESGKRRLADGSYSHFCGDISRGGA
jgi:methionyl-tRNA formyltransferase